jgi:hypothetical protein
MNTNAATGSGPVIQAHQAIAEDIKALGVDTVFGLMLHFLRMRSLPEAKSAFPDVDFAPVAAGSESRLGRSARWRTCKPRRPCCAARKARCSWTAS